MLRTHHSPERASRTCLLFSRFIHNCNIKCRSTLCVLFNLYFLKEGSQKKNRREQHYYNQHSPCPELKFYIFPLDKFVTYHESGNGVDGYTLVLPPRALVSVPEPAVRQTEAGVAGPDREGSHVVPVHVVREGKTPVLESYNKNKIGQSFYSKQCTFL